MRRKNTTNQLMKEYIAESFIRLLEQRNLNNITINEITKLAGVNRSTYYRNFSSTYEIIKFYIGNIMTEYLNEFSEKTDLSLVSYYTTLFQCFYKHRKALLCIHRNSLSYLALEVFNQSFTKKAINSDTSNKQLFELYYHTGGIYNFLLLWLEHNMKEEPEEMMKITLSILPSDFLPYFKA